MAAARSRKGRGRPGHGPGRLWPWPRRPGVRERSKGPGRHRSVTKSRRRSPFLRSSSVVAITRGHFDLAMAGSKYAACFRPSDPGPKRMRTGDIPGVPPRPPSRSRRFRHGSGGRDRPPGGMCDGSSEFVPNPRPSRRKRDAPNQPRTPAPLRTRPRILRPRGINRRGRRARRGSAGPAARPPPGPSGRPGLAGRG